MPRSIGAILMLNALGNIWYIVQLHHKQRRKKRLPLKPGKKSPCAAERPSGNRVLSHNGDVRPACSVIYCKAVIPGKRNHRVRIHPRFSELFRGRRVKSCVVS